MDETRISYLSELRYYTQYIVIEAAGLGGVSNPLFPGDKLEIGDVVSFKPKRTWGIDDPIAVIICKDGRDIGEISPIGTDVMFQLGMDLADPDLVRGWRLALPEDAEALFSGVPIEDIYV